MRDACPRCGEPFDRPTRNYLRPLANTVVPSGHITCAACQGTVPLVELVGPEPGRVELDNGTAHQEGGLSISEGAAPVPMPMQGKSPGQPVTAVIELWQRPEYAAVLAKVAADRASPWDSEMRQLWSSIGNHSQDAAKAHMARCLELATEQTHTCIRGEAERLATSGDRGRALLLLETLHGASPEDKQKTLAKDISAFRAKHGLGQVWEFYSTDNTVIAKCSGAADIYKKLIDGELSRSTLFRKNEIGPLLRTEASLGEENAELELLLRPVAYYTSRWAAVFAILGFIGSWVHSIYNVSAIWHTGFFKTGAFAVCYLVLIGGVVKGQWLVALIASFLGALISRGHLPNAFSFGGFVLGNLLSNALSALVAGALGGAIGAVIGTARRPFLPKLRD